LQTIPIHSRPLRTAPASEPEAVEQLKPLAFLVGDWQAEKNGPAEGQVTKMKISYKWLFDGTFLRATYTVESGSFVTGSESTYRWDPLTKTVRASIIGDYGGWNDAVVTFADGAIRVKATGVSGKSAVSFTRLLQSKGPDEHESTFLEAEVDGEKSSLPPMPTTRWQRIK
jgi:hypothetical protein